MHPGVFNLVQQEVQRVPKEFLNRLQLKMDTHRTIHFLPFIVSIIVSDFFVTSSTSTFLLTSDRRLRTCLSRASMMAEAKAIKYNAPVSYPMRHRCCNNIMHYFEVVNRFARWYSTNQLVLVNLITMFLIEYVLHPAHNLLFWTYCSISFRASTTNSRNQLNQQSPVDLCPHIVQYWSIVCVPPCLRCSSWMKTPTSQVNVQGNWMACSLK